VATLIFRSMLKGAKHTPTVDAIIEENKDAIILSKRDKKEFNEVKDFIDKSIVEDLSNWKKYNLLCKAELEEELYYRGYSLLHLPDEDKDIETFLLVIKAHQEKTRYKSSWSTIQVVEKTFKLLEDKKISISFAQSIFNFIYKYNDCYFEESLSLYEDVFNKINFKLSPILSIKLDLELGLYFKLVENHAFKERTVAIRKLLLNESIEPKKRNKTKEILALVEENNELLFSFDNIDQIKTYRENEKKIRKLSISMFSADSKEIKAKENKKNKVVKNIKPKNEIIKNDTDADVTIEESITHMKNAWDELPEEEKNSLKVSLSTLLEGLTLDSESLKHEMYKSYPEDERYKILQASRDIRSAIGDLKDNVIQFLSNDNFSEDDLYTLAMAVQNKAPKILDKEKDKNLNEKEKLVIEELTSE